MMTALLWTALASGNPQSIDAPAIVSHTTKPIVVDGQLTEAIWQTAVPVTSFKRYIPTDGDAPPGITEIRFVQDTDTLYIGISVRDVDYPIQARISPREDVNDDDQVGIMRSRHIVCRLWNAVPGRYAARLPGLHI